MGPGNPAGPPQEGHLPQMQGPQLSRGLPSQAPAVASPELVRHAGSQTTVLLTVSASGAHAHVSTSRLEKMALESWASEFLHREPLEVPTPLTLVGSTLKVPVVRLISHRPCLHALCIISHASAWGSKLRASVIVCCLLRGPESASSHS